MKPLNSSSGTASYLMRGGEVAYQYLGKTNIPVKELEEFLLTQKDTVVDDPEVLREKAKGKSPETKISVTVKKEERGVSRVVKGVRGALRHSIMHILHQKGIPYCSPTMKEKFQGSEKSTLLEGEHLMGGCGEEPCPIRQLFGMLGEESPVRVWSDVIIQTERPSANIIPQKGLAFVHTSTENRHQARRDKKSLQDFSEQYFSGEFSYYVEFTKESLSWLIGLLVEGILGINHLGRGSNAGYGRVEIKSIAYEKVTVERKLGPENGEGKMIVIEEERTENLNNNLSKVREAWQKYSKK
ncbi:MAG: RAMP superfamily CRISPR-associated protein [Candidatus Thorarchaeota archaeon]